MTDIIKITQIYDRNKNPWSGLTRKEAFNLEKNCLKILNSNFKCLCDVNCDHFPKIISCYPDKYKFVLSNCGYSFDKYESLVKKKKIKPIIIKNMEEQIDCIIYNLKKCKIKHLDMHLSGKNICLNKKGILSLIDFDIASIDNKKKDIENAYEKDIENTDEKDIENAFEKDIYYIKLKKRIISIISKVL